MSKIVLDYGPIENNAISSLENVINSLNDVINFLQQGSIPRDFYGRTTLLNTIADLKAQMDKLTNIKNWLISSNKNYDSMIDKLCAQASKLPVYQVKQRKTIV